jgi:hypothetical protein
MSRDNYDPRPGVHVCGADEGTNEFVTIAQYPRSSRALFNQARSELAAGPGEPFDMVVDLVDDDGDTADDFHITRQMLPRLERMLTVESRTSD